MIIMLMTIIVVIMDIIIYCQFWGGRVWENDDAYAILWGSRMLLVRMTIIMIR